MEISPFRPSGTPVDAGGDLSRTSQTSRCLFAVEIQEGRPRVFPNGKNKDPARSFAPGVLIHSRPRWREKERTLDDQRNEQRRPSVRRCVPNLREASTPNPQLTPVSSPVPSPVCALVMPHPWTWVADDAMVDRTPGLRPLERSRHQRGLPAPCMERRRRRPPTRANVPLPPG